MDYMEQYTEWLTSNTFDDNIKKELIEIKENKREISDRFYKDLEFGTGGLRAIIGAGTNRLNKYTIRRISYGYGNFLLKEYGDVAKTRGIMIAHDMREGSVEFTLEVAKTLAALGIKTWLFKEITTTPELSFAVPLYNTIGGIVITASHNPPEYNGYKIYDYTGCQLTPLLADKVIAEINQVTDYNSIQVANDDSQFINWLDESVDTKFINAVKTKMIHPEVIKEVADEFKIVYTPLHGTGRKPIFRVLKEAGFKNIYTVKEQLTEDPGFYTVKSPNPEDIEAFDMALKVAKENKADLIMATDPDCDRVGAVIKHHQEYISLTGNQIGSLLVYYMITTNKKQISSMYNPYIIKTIVTSDLGVKIANKYNVKAYDTLTGFKFIGEKINTIENKGEFLMGYEESYGYLVGTHARDKDGVSSALLISEMSAYYFKEGNTLIDVLKKIYKEFGYYKESLFSMTLEGEKGLKKIKLIMQEFREIKPVEFENFEIEKIKDYSTNIDGLPKSDVLKFFFKDKSWLAVRPSGTEPKIKFYLGVVGIDSKDATAKLQKLNDFIQLFF